MGDVNGLRELCTQSERDAVPTPKDVDGTGRGGPWMTAGVTGDGDGTGNDHDDCCGADFGSDRGVADNMLDPAQRGATPFVRLSQRAQGGPETIDSGSVQNRVPVSMSLRGRVRTRVCGTRFGGMWCRILVHLVGVSRVRVPSRVGVWLCTRG